MGEKISEILKKLTQKEKIVIIASMSALAAVLITLVFILAFCGGNNNGNEPNLPDSGNVGTGGNGGNVGGGDNGGNVGGGDNGGNNTNTHTHNYDCTLSYVGNQFLFIGKCSVDGCDKPDIAMAGVEPTVVDVIEPTCKEEGQIVYSYTYETFNATYTEYTDRTEHKLDGVVISELLNEDGSLNSNIHGVALNVTSDMKCGQVYAGSYICQDCEEVNTINVFLTHAEDSNVTLEPDCLTNGETTIVCTRCSAIIGKGDEIPALGHSYEYEIQKNGDKTNVIGSCTRKDCPDPAYVENNVKLTLTKETDSTCAKAGEMHYSFTDNSGKKVAIVIYKEKTEHVLNGKDYTLFEREDGTYPHTLPGIEIPPNVTIQCGQTSWVHFICEGCGQPILIAIKPPAHDTYIANTTNPTKTEAGYTYLKCRNDGCQMNLKINLPKIEVGKNATLISGGVVGEDEIYQYTHTELGQTIKLTITIPYSHTHNYAYDLLVEGANIILVGKCSEANCNKPNLRDEGITGLKELEKVAANCLHGSKVKYSCTLSTGEAIEFEIVDDKTTDDHILHGETPVPTEPVWVDGAMVMAYIYDGGKNGIIAFGEVKPGEAIKGYYTCENCNKLIMVDIFVPKDYKADN